MIAFSRFSIFQFFFQIIGEKNDTWTHKCDFFIVDEKAKIP